MHYPDLVQLFFERSNALQWHWTLYVVVVGGLLAFSSLRVRPDFITGILITVLFSMFAYKNLDAIKDITYQRHAALDLIQQFAPNPFEHDAIASRQTLETSLIAPDYPGVRNFHIASDLLTIAAIWAMERRRIRNARSEPRP